MTDEAVFTHPSCPVELWDTSKPAFTCAGNGEVVVDDLWVNQNSVIHIGYDLHREKYASSWDDLDPWSYALFRREYIRTQQGMRSAYHRNIGTYLSSEECLPSVIRDKRNRCLRIMGERITTIDRRKGAGSYWDKNSIEYISIVDDIQRIAEKHRTVLIVRQGIRKETEAAKALEREERKFVLAEESTRWMDALEKAISRAEVEGGLISEELQGSIDSLINKKSSPTEGSIQLLKTAAAHVLAGIPSKPPSSVASKEQESVIRFLERELDVSIPMEVAVRIDQRRFAIDGVFEIDGLKVALEYDGRYWHAPAEVYQKDIIKTLYLVNNGYLLVRIRDYRLPPLPLDDSRFLPIDDFTQQESDSQKHLDQLVSLGDRIKSFVSFHQTMRNDSPSLLLAS